MRTQGAHRSGRPAAHLAARPDGVSTAPCESPAKPGAAAMSCQSPKLHKRRLGERAAGVSCFRRHQIAKTAPPWVSTSCAHLLCPPPVPEPSPRVATPAQSPPADGAPGCVSVPPGVARPCRPGSARWPGCPQGGKCTMKWLLVYLQNYATIITT